MASLQAVSRSSSIFFYFLRDRIIEQLTAELQALKEELESFRLEVSEMQKGRKVMCGKRVWNMFNHREVKGPKSKKEEIFLCVF